MKTCKRCKKDLEDLAYNKSMVTCDGCVKNMQSYNIRYEAWAEFGPELAKRVEEFTRLQLDKVINTEDRIPITIKESTVKAWHIPSEGPPQTAKRRGCHPKELVRCDMQGNVKKVYSSGASVKLDGFSPSQVSKCCNGTLTSHRGFIWRFV